MSVFHENMLIGSSGQGGAAAAYTIQRSLRFNSADSAYLSRTPASAGNRKTWTWAGWAKRSALGGDQVVFAAGGSNNEHYGVVFASDALATNHYIGSQAYQCITSAVFRDVSAWYHVLVAYDSTQATASNRIKIYVNGILQSLSTANYPSLNYDGQINTTAGHTIAKHPNASVVYFNGYLADIHFIDGQALTPTSFGQFDANNVWQPKAYSGTYGTNGFKLDFADNSNNTAATLGKDTSGNGLNWTPTNLSVTAGAGNDSLRDSPTSGGTDTGLGGQVTGNYATWNPLDSSGITFSNGNLDIFGIDTGCGATFAPSSGKWYWEITLGTPYVGSGSFYGIFGLSIGRQGSYISAFTGYTGAGVRATTGTGGGTWANGTLSTTQTTWSTGDVLGFAYDADAKTLDVYRNNTKIGSTLTVPTAATTISAHQNGSGTGSNSVANFGARAFAYTAPSGFKALCTANLPTPTIANGATAMDVLTWSGNGSNPRTFTGLKHGPDLVWIKERNTGAWSHCLFDQLRGNAVLHSNLTNAETATHPYGYVSAFTSDGFTVAAGSSGDEQVNDSAITYVGWTWDGGTSTVTNNSGSISSQVRANSSAGFSIVTYTGTGSNGSIGHGLGISPSLIITKNRTTAGIDWIVYHPSLDSGKVLLLNSAIAQFAPAGGTYGTITSAAYGVTIGSNFGNLNATGDNYVAYCFAPVAGYSAFGSYTGNGQTGTSGPFIFCGFRPKFVLIKKSNDNDNWKIFDSVRDTYNVTEKSLQPNVSNAELIEAYNKVDILSNGFAIRVTNAAFGLNTNHSFIWAAWAEHPFQYARAR